MTLVSHHPTCLSAVETAEAAYVASHNGEAGCADHGNAAGRIKSAPAKLQRMQEAVKILLSGIAGEDLTREGLLDTPKRVAKAWLEMSRGYDEQATSVLGGAFFREPSIQRSCGGVVIVRDIEFASLSESLLLPFFGHCHIAYLPCNGLVLGLSKFARITRQCSKRVQDQKGLTQRIWRALQGALLPSGLVVISQGKHITGREEGPVLRTECCVGGCFTKGDELLLQEVLMLLQLPPLDALDAVHSLSDPYNAGDKLDVSMEHQQNGDNMNMPFASALTEVNPSLAPGTPDLQDNGVHSLCGVDPCGVVLSVPSSNRVASCLAFSNRVALGLSSSIGEPLGLSSSNGVASGLPMDLQTLETSRLRRMESALNIMLREIGEDPTRKGLSDAACTYAVSLLSSTSGYAMQLPSPSPWFIPASQDPGFVPPVASPHSCPHNNNSQPTNAASRPLQECNHQACCHRSCKPYPLPSSTWDHAKLSPSFPAWDNMPGLASSLMWERTHQAASCEHPVLCSHENGVAAHPSGTSRSCAPCSDSSLQQYVISFSSQCEHHLLPFYGHVLVAWMPGPGSRSLSIAQVQHVVRMYTWRLQMQERITQQVADGVQHITQAQGVLVLTSASHMCMVARGVECHGSSTLSIAARGLLEHNTALRLKIIGTASKHPLLMQHQSSP